MSSENYDNDEIEFAGVITIDSDAIVIADPTKKISDGVVIRDFGGNGVYPVFIIRDSNGDVVGITINFDVDDSTEEDLTF
jgi:hypothetical protein|tara:strand:- start:856 stop:1095 length:240 start_codon:yes stop_codon:yes gene_type:complete